MTDLLDRVIGPAFDLVERIDASLERFGAPPDHPVWSLIRRVGALPRAAVAHFVELTPGAVLDAARQLGELAEGCRDEIVAPADAAWRGVTADAFAIRWTEVTANVTGGEDSLASRLDATASYLTEVSDWIAASRHSIAGELAVCLGARETVVLRTAGEPNLGLDRPAIVVAADLGARVLDVVSRCVDDGWQVRLRWAGVLGEVPVRRSAVLHATTTTHIELR